MRMWNPRCVIAVFVALNVSAARDAIANPVNVTYLDVAAQCADPPNVTLTDELGLSPPFPAGETITYVITTPPPAGDCGFLVAVSRTNDGCPQVGPSAETGPQCDNDTDDDADGKVNDGCPVLGMNPETGVQCDNATDDDMFDDIGSCQITATNTSGFCLTDVFVVADPGTTFSNWDGTIGGSPAKKIAGGKVGWPPGSVITFTLMNVLPPAFPAFLSLGVNSADPASNFSIVANIVKTGGVGACCGPNDQCSQLTECECTVLGKDFSYRGEGTPCGPNNTCIPAVSEWGLLVMAVLVLTAATVVIMRRRAMTHGRP